MRRRAAFAVLAGASAVAACTLLTDLDGLSSTAPAADASDDTSSGSDGTIAGEGGADTATADADADTPVDVLGCDAPDLVAFYKMDEGSGVQVKDCSASAINGALEPDGGSWAGGVRGGAVALDDGYVNLGDVPGLQLTGAITVAAYVRIVGLGSSERPAIVSKMGGDGKRGWELAIETAAEGRGARFTISPDNFAELKVVSGTIPSDQWVHIAGSYTPGEALRVYVNGSLAAAQAGAPAAMANAAVTARIGGRSYAYYFHGLLDEVRIFRRALGEAEIAQLARR